MQLARIYAGYTLGEADILRRAMSKKKKELLEKEESKFIEKSIEHNHTKEQAQKLTFTKTDSQDKEYETTLYDIWKREVIEHDWLYAEDTDVFVKCDIPEYDKDPIYFARTKDGGWFSMDVTSWWQGGRLDVDGKRYESLMKYYNEMD